MAAVWEALQKRLGIEKQELDQWTHMSRRMKLVREADIDVWAAFDEGISELTIRGPRSFGRPPPVCSGFWGWTAWTIPRASPRN